MTCRVVIADDVEGIRRLWRLLLEAQPDIEVVGEASDGDQAVEAVRALRPDVLVLDLSMPRRDGLEVLRELQRDGAPPAIVIASGFSDSRFAPVTKDLGAAAYFEKGTPVDELVELVRAACWTDVAVPGESSPA